MMSAWSTRDKMWNTSHIAKLCSMTWRVIMHHKPAVAWIIKIVIWNTEIGSNTNIRFYKIILKFICTCYKNYLFPYHFFY